MRALGVDLGDVRIGLAVSDPAGRVATPLETLPVVDAEDREAIAADVAAVAQREEAEVVVVGLPRALSGREERPAQRARAIAELIGRASGLPVELWDERFTTVEAERVMIEQGVRRRERRASVDRVAATILLQSWLDRRRGDGGSPGWR